MPAIENQDTGANAKTILQVLLLGAPELLWAGETLEIPRRQPRAILYRLASGPEPISRDHLCLLLWPDFPESEARRHLSNQLYNLRRSLPVRDVIQARSNRLFLDRRRAWSDATAFERLSQSSQTDDLQRAVALYRGPFLDGFSLAEDGEFSRWMDERRRVLQLQFLDALSSLMAKYTAQGDYDASIACARRYLETDDLAEGVHRRLIDLYAAQGNRSAALRQYERCATILERELGVDPLPETREVYLAVLQDGTVRAEPSRPPPVWTTLPSLEAPLVGREEAMSKLDSAFSRARAGVGSTVLISGEAGVGKSRLLQEFVTRCAGEASVLAESGYEAQGEVPYLPLVEALRSLLPTIDWGILGADPLHLEQLLRILPELSSFVSGLSEPSSAEQQQEESPLFRALAHLLLCLARQHPPLILCLDDLHWIDETTRSWLVYLARRLKDAPLLLLGGYRSQEATAVEPLRAGLARLNVLQEVKLQGLNEQDVRRLIGRLSNQTVGHERFCRRLQRLTGGNPFFLLETLRALFETGLMQQDASGWRSDMDRLSASFAELPWPESVTETVRRRVDRLQPTTAQVLQAGAVLGRHFNPDLVQATSGRSQHEVLNALDELAARQLIIVAEDRCRFRHDLIRAIVADGLGYGRRRLLHRRAGEALEDREPENAAALARHFAAAGEAQKAVDYSLQAGKQARLMYAQAEAVDHYRRAVRLLKAEGEDARAARTLMTLGLTYQTAYNYRSARQAYEEGFALRRRTLANPPAVLPPAPHALRLSLFSAPNPLRLLLDNPLALDPGNPKVPDIILRQLFSGLLRSGNDWTIQPEIARAWEVSDDGRRYVFYLRDDALWTDGEPVTARDFAFAWKRVLDPQTGGFLREILYTTQEARAFRRKKSAGLNSVTVRVVDSLTLEVQLEEPAGYFLNLLTDRNMVPLPRHVVERHGKYWTEPGYLVSNGPFQLQDWKPGERLTLARNPAYSGRFRGNLMKVLISNHWMSPVDQLQAYRAGKMDILCLGPETYHARPQHAEEYHQAQAAKTYTLGFSATESTFDDRRVRQALALAIDKNQFARQILPGFDLPATGGFLPPGFPGHSPEIGLPFDPRRARRLLAEAGYPDGKGFPRVDLLTAGARVRYSQALQKIWQRHLGIHVQIKVMEWEDFSKQLQMRQAPLFIVGWWAAHYPDPDYYLRVGVRNLAGWWQHSDYEQLIKDAGQIRDMARRLRRYRQAERILMEEAVTVPLVYRVEHYLIKPWVKTSLPNYLPYFSLADVILEPH